MGQLMVSQQRVNPIFPVPVDPRRAEGAIPAAGTSEEFGAFIASEIARRGAVVKRTGMEAQ